MNVQEKYDEFSKLCAGRVFAGRADTPEQSVFHSYTLEVMPYWEEYPKRKTEAKDKLSSTDYARQLGKDMMISLLDLLDMNPESKFSEADLDKIRRNIAKECYNEQLRKVLVSKKQEASLERCSYSEITKNRHNFGDKELSYHN